MPVGGIYPLHHHSGSATAVASLKNSQAVTENVAVFIMSKHRRMLLLRFCESGAVVDS